MLGTPAVTPGATPERAGKTAPFTRRLAVGLAAAAGAFGLAGEFTGLAWSDTLWLLHVAGRILDGSRLYLDIIEVNPPLIFWLALPVVQLARWIDIDPLTLWRLTVALALTASVMATARLLRSWRVLPWVAFVLFVVPGRPVFGEREHLILAALMPWLAVAVRRLRAQAAPDWIGLPAAFAFALKPQYLPLGLAVLWLEARRIGWRSALRLPEHRLTLGLLAVYVVAVVALTPEYLDVLRTYGGLYSDYLGASLPAILTDRSVAVAWVALVLYLLVRFGRTADRTPADLLALLVIASLGAVLLQGKGLWYHYYPVLTAGLLLLAVLRTMAAHLASGVLAVALVTMRLPEAAGLRSVDEVRDLAIIRALTISSRPTSLGVLDPSGDVTPFRYAFYADVQWSPRWPFPWPLNLPRAPRTDSVVAGELDAMVADPPDLLLVRATDAYNPIDVAALLAEFPAYDALRPGYVEGPRAGHYRVLRRVR